MHYTVILTNQIIILIPQPVFQSQITNEQTTSPPFSFVVGAWRLHISFIGYFDKQYKQLKGIGLLSLFIAFNYH